LFARASGSFSSGTARPNARHRLLGRQPSMQAPATVHHRHRIKALGQVIKVPRTNPYSRPANRQQKRARNHNSTPVRTVRSPRRTLGKHGAPARSRETFVETHKTRAPSAQRGRQKGIWAPRHAELGPALDYGSNAEPNTMRS
jgi:hypothetical protein